MKNLLSKNPALIAMSWFAVIGIVAVLLSSCAGGHFIQCDAYGKVDTKEHLNLKSKYTFKVTNKTKESFLANNK